MSKISLLELSSQDNIFNEIEAEQQKKVKAAGVLGALVGTVGGYAAGSIGYTATQAFKEFQQPGSSNWNQADLNSAAFNTAVVSGLVGSLPALP